MVLLNSEAQRDNFVKNIKSQLLGFILHETGLNSLEILSFLKFAYQITGRDIFQNEYLRLIREEGYLENAKSLYTTNPAWETYFDIYLALYIYPALINLEKDPDLNAEYRAHLDQWFNKFEETKSPLLNFTYNLLAGGSDELDNSIFFLKDAPLDLVDWTIDNGKREDLHLVREPILEDIQVNELRPPSEYRTMRWDRNPYHAIAGNPAQEREPVYWLLPYWMGRYIKQRAIFKPEIDEKQATTFQYDYCRDDTWYHLGNKRSIWPRTGRRLGRCCWSGRSNSD